MTWLIPILIAVLVLALVGITDILQTGDPIRRNYPVVGHGRWLLKSLGPKLRQYIVAANDDERPFTRDQRDWVYRSSGKVNNYFGFGTDNRIDSTPNYLIIKHSSFPLPEPHEGDPGYDPMYSLPCAKSLVDSGNGARPFGRLP